MARASLPLTKRRDKQKCLLGLEPPVPTKQWRARCPLHGAHRIMGFDRTAPPLRIDRRLRRVRTQSLRRYSLRNIRGNFVLYCTRHFLGPILWKSKATAALEEFQSRQPFMAMLPSSTFANPQHRDVHCATLLESWRLL